MSDDSQNKASAERVTKLRESITMWTTEAQTYESTLVEKQKELEFYEENVKMIKDKLKNTEQQVLIAENEAVQAEQEATSALELVVLEGYAKKKEQTSILVTEKANQNKEVLLTEKVEIEKEIIEATQEKDVSQKNIDESTKIITQTKK